MSYIGSDQEYLRNSQYKDASNLNARVQLHARFGASKSNWQQWVFDHFQLPAESRVLELGSGPGYLWLNNLQRIPTSWHAMVSFVFVAFQAYLKPSHKSWQSNYGRAVIFRLLYTTSVFAPPLVLEARKASLPCVKVVSFIEMRKLPFA